VNLFTEIDILKEIDRNRLDW